MRKSDLKVGVQALFTIEQAVASLNKDSLWPISLLLGIIAIVGCTTKVPYFVCTYFLV